MEQKRQDAHLVCEASHTPPIHGSFFPVLLFLLQPTWCIQDTEFIAFLVANILNTFMYCLNEVSAQ